MRWQENRKAWAKQKAEKAKGRNPWQGRRGRRHDLIIVVKAYYWQGKTPDWAALLQNLTRAIRPPNAGHKGRRDGPNHPQEDEKQGTQDSGCNHP